MTTNQQNHLKMLEKMHPALFEKFGNQIRLNQKFHPNMTGKILNNLAALSQTPNGTSKLKEFIMLQTPVQPKPPSFFEQAYKGKEDQRKKQTLSQSRPFSAYKADDIQSYMSHHKLKQQMQKQQKTLDPHCYSRTKKIKKRGKKQDEEEEWERFNENVSFKSGYSRRSNRSHNSRRPMRVKSAASSRHIPHRHANDKVAAAYGTKIQELTQNNLRDFEEKISSQAAGSRRREKIVFNDKHEAQKTFPEDTQKVPDDLLEEQKHNDMEGEGEEDQENPNEAENELAVNDDEHQSILPRSEVQSMSRVSRKSYVESLRYELQKEREKRRELETQVKELLDSK